jgi:hypothetical protein
MEPISTALGLAGTVDQVAGLAKTVVSNIYLYCEAVKDAPANAQQVREDLQVLSGLLDQFKEIVFDHEDRFSFSGEFQKTLSRFKDLLDRLNGRVVQKRAEGIKRFIWPFTKDENNRLLSEIRGLMDTFHVAMNIQTTFSPAPFLAYF